MHPQNLHHNANNAHVLASLLNCLAFIRLACFGSSIFATWAPNLFHYYTMHLRDLLVHDTMLVINWTQSIFATVTFNFGPRMLCFCHTDSSNLPFSWCTITALRRFNHWQGGHLILWDLKLVIDFPPGSTILIPSAILWHSNTNIGRREQRYSFTQYTSGGLFWWVDHNFQTSKEYWGSLKQDQHAAAQRMQQGRWEFGLSMFSMLEDLRCCASGV
ncbi:hypothetical protein ARMSODRAFT_989542 [Armillaria solidipes]|uniref:Uncharacterized protein n=1 Tax=Armillaria solidipes TaxID=1076256 RepID=A0A2H3B937_9AGAR|nr:hypothetical protein ARMSODRAFT_989542 [Armillaria solidipes]